MSKKQRPFLSPEDQIKHLDKKGVKFDLISKQDAIKYLCENNNFFKLTAYRKNFAKNGKDKYIDLDFKYLIDLAVIDMRLRYILIQMALDIEHYSKVRLLKKIKDSQDDGYQIVSKYYDKLQETDNQNNTHWLNALKDEIRRNCNSPYCGSIISKYNSGFPVWAFLEIIPFGRFVSFYSFCADYFDDKQLKDEFFLLTTCKELRNAVAHSNCIINDLSSKDGPSPGYCVNRELMQIKELSKFRRKKRMSNVRIQQVVTLLYTHKVLVGSVGSHEHTAEILQNFKNRMYRELDYYKNNDMITSTFDFLKIVIDNWFN